MTVVPAITAAIPVSAAPSPSRCLSPRISLTIYLPSHQSVKAENDLGASWIKSRRSWILGGGCAAWILGEAAAVAAEEEEEEKVKEEEEENVEEEEELVVEEGDELAATLHTARDEPEV